MQHAHELISNINPKNVYNSKIVKRWKWLFYCTASPFLIPWVYFADLLAYFFLRKVFNAGLVVECFHRVPLVLSKVSGYFLHQGMAFDTCSQGGEAQGDDFSALSHIQKPTESDVREQESLQAV